MSARFDSLTRLALRAVEDIEVRAYVGPVDISLSDRLALEWLVGMGIAERWQAKRFIAETTAPIPYQRHGNAHHYLRTTCASASLDVWHQKAGIKRRSMPELAVAGRRYCVEMLDPEDGQPEPWHMCNRYRPGHREMVTQLFAARPLRAMNDGPAIVHPRDPGFVVRRHKGEMVLDQMSWGFPVVLRGKQGQPLKPRPVNNARFDKLDKFWQRWARNPVQRCLVPAACYAEAEGQSGSMVTTWLWLKSTPVFAWAGLWTNSDQWGPVYTCVMTDNAPELADIHDRSPVILAPEDWEAWLTAPLEDLQQFDRPWPADDTEVLRTQVLWTKGGREDAYIGTSPTVPWALGSEE